MRGQDNTRRPRGTGTAIFKKRTGAWVARWTFKGERIERKPGRGTRHEVGRLLHSVEGLREQGMDLQAAVREAMGEPKLEDATREVMTFSRLLDLYLDAQEAAGEKKPLSLHTDRMRAHILRGSSWASLEVGTFAVREVRLWTAERREGGTSDGTLLNDLSTASSAVRWGQEEEIVEDGWNPFLRAKPRKPKRRERAAMTPDELRAVDAAMREVAPEVYPFWVCAATTGFRVREQAAITWGDVDLERGTIRVRAKNEKNRRDKVAAVAPQLHGLLMDLRDGDRTRSDLALVFTRPDGGPWGSSPAGLRLRKAFALCVKREQEQRPGLARGPFEAKCDGDEDTLPLDWHSIRHTARSIAESAGMSSLVLDKVLGQNDPRTAQRYTHVFDRDRALIAETLGAALTG